MATVLFGTDRGDRSEERFLSAARKRTSATPKWFRGVRRGSVKFDVNGVDMIAKIKRRDDWKVMSVPIQVKSSSGGKRRFYAERPEAKRLGIPVIVVTDDATPDSLRAELYEALRPFLSAQRDHFKRYFTGIGRGKLSSSGKRISDMLTKKRRSLK
jgi:hypothetical protein